MEYMNISISIYICKHVRGGSSVAMTRFMLRHPCLEYICGNAVGYFPREKANYQTNKRNW